MDDRTMIVVFVLCVAAVSDMPVTGQSLDVCASCHINATCEDKFDGPGKVCNCKYGFVGNGRTYCQDKDECQIGAIKICGLHTNCHNTFGSYYCTCFHGYSPSNNMAIFIPNDGTHCQDIDECRIVGVCGEGALCRNLDGSYDCSCKLGYRVHNGHEPYHPETDHATCEVVDCGPPVSVEDATLLSITGTTYDSVATFTCDEGFLWRRGDNMSVCGADGQWRPPTMVCEGTGVMRPTQTIPVPGAFSSEHSFMSVLWLSEVDCGPPPDLPHSHTLWNNSSRMGAEVVYQCNSGYRNVGKASVSTCSAAGQWEGPSVLCKEILCGNPPVVESTEQVWDGNLSPGSTVLYICKDGFYYNGEHNISNISVCNENGQWTPPTLSCQEIICGAPLILPHTGKVWNGSSKPGSTVTYFCKTGFYYSEGNNVSLCTIYGHWTEANMSCKEVDCGVPPTLPHSVMQWDKSSTVGSKVIYKCNSGYKGIGDRNVSVCKSTGEWEDASLLCQEINCQEPGIKPNAKILWDGTSHIGSVVYYECDEGFYTQSLRNYSVCGQNGCWDDVDFWCEEISCGPPLSIPVTNLLWDGSSSAGSVVMYECKDGFYQESGNNVSTCSVAGEWMKVSVTCKATCGPAPSLKHSEVVWHNRSVVIHSCVDGFHSWRGNNMSVCDSSGVWNEATLKCVEVKPPINHLHVINEKCLLWKAEKYEEDTEVYKVTFTGSRDYQMSFHDKRKRSLSSKAEELKLCLNLLPLTNYSIFITATSARFTASITINTSLPVPAAPVVYYREFETPVPTLTLRRSQNTLDSISLYQVFVLPVERIMVFDCSSPGHPNPETKSTFSDYIVAQIQVRCVGTEMNFTVGDGLYYEGFFNAPLQNGRSYYIILRAVSQWKTALKSSCVLWAKVRGTSYALKVSMLSAAAAVGLVAMAILFGYSFIWCFRRM